MFSFFIEESNCVMKNILLPYYKENSYSKYISKITGMYCIGILLFVFITIASLSISSYVVNKLAFDFYPNDSTILNSDQTTESENLNFTEVIVKKGDTLGKIFSNQQMSSYEATSILQSIKKSNINITLKPGQLITFDYNVSDKELSDDALNDYLLKEVTIEVDKAHNIVISKLDGKFVVKDITISLKKMLVKYNVAINNSFIKSLTSIGISAANVQELVNAYSYQVDFQRSIKSGDTISILTEKFYSEDGEFVRGGKVVYSSLNLSGKTYNIYWYKDQKSGNGQYYSENGKSVKRNLLRTPINVARISSNFGNRHHPVLGYTKMHKGVDFAAPNGTPIYAAGDGVITEAGYRGAYGNIVRIKHSSSLATAYAHASKFANNIRPGTKVKQGQVIAYVGSTGRTTGSHCHFEVLINGKHVNPTSVQTVPGQELKNDALKLFHSHKQYLQTQSEKIAPGTPIEVFES